MPEARRPLPGTRYALIRPLGEGAMGEVFLGEHEELGKRVVIKLLRAQLSNRDDLVSRLRQEARLLAQIRHPALVDIYDLSITADGRPFFVMEYIEGYNLRDFLAGAGGVLSAPHACELMAQALDGLDAAHQRGIVHRDVKPENLLVATDGRVKILDFGVAKVFGDSSLPHTAAGLVVGTPRYMSPEQARGDALSPATDLYAVGCVLFELLTGQLPFAVATAREMLLAHISVPPPSLSARARSYFDPELEALVAQSLAKDPRRRPVGASVMALQLRRLSARLTGKTTTITDDKPTVQVDLNAAAIEAQRARDPIDSTTTSPVSTPDRVSLVDGGASAPTERLAVLASPSAQPNARANAPTEALAALPRHLSGAPPPAAPAHDPLTTAATEEAEVVRGSTGLRRGVIAVAAAGLGLAAVVGVAALVLRAYDARGPRERIEPAATAATAARAVEGGASAEGAVSGPPITPPSAGASSEPVPPSATAGQVPITAETAMPSPSPKPSALASAQPTPLSSAASTKSSSAPPPSPTPKTGPGAMDDRN
ncbi:MAG: hypothetical protein NVSMB47_01920 [Polyangiales bacterium]